MIRKFSNPVGKYDNSAWGAYPSEILFYNARKRKAARIARRRYKRAGRRAQEAERRAETAKRNIIDANDLKAISGAIHGATRGYVAMNRTPTTITATVTTTYFEALKQGNKRKGHLQVIPINAKLLRDLAALSKTA